MERAAAGQNFQNGAGRGRGERGRWNILDKSEDILWYFGGCELQVIRHCIAINSTLGPGPFLNPGSAIRRHGKRHSHRGEICVNPGEISHHSGTDDSLQNECCSTQHHGKYDDNQDNSHDEQ